MRYDVDPSEDALIIAAKLRRNVRVATKLQTMELDIPLVTSDLIKFLDLTDGLKMGDILDIIENSASLDWVRSADHLQNQRSSGRPSILRDNSFFEERAVSEGLKDAYTRACLESKALELDCESYSHNAFHCYAAARIYADKGSVSVASSPTGSVKTFIGALLAKMY